MKIRNVLAILGTPREAIRLAPLVLAMRREIDLRPIVVVTGEQPPEFREILTLFDITADFTVNVDPDCAPLSRTATRSMSGLDHLLSEEPDLVIAQGHTDTTFAAIVAAFFHRVPVVLVSDGLQATAWRAGAMDRLLAMRLCGLQLASTPPAAQSLIDHAVPPDSIVCIGDPAIDSLLTIVARPATHRSRLLDELEQHDGPVLLVDRGVDGGAEQVGALSRALVQLATKKPALRIVVPMGANRAGRELLSQIPQVVVTEPFGYELTCRVIQHSDVIITDSDDVQAAGCTLGKPVLGLGGVLVRPAVPQGSVPAVGLDETAVAESVLAILRCPFEYQAMVAVPSPHGDGLAAQRAVAAIRHFFGVGRRPAGFRSGTPAGSETDRLASESLRPNYV